MACKTKKKIKLNKKLIQENIFNVNPVRDDIFNKTKTAVTQIPGQVQHYFNDRVQAAKAMNHAAAHPATHMASDGEGHMANVHSMDYTGGN